MNWIVNLALKILGVAKDFRLWWALFIKNPWVRFIAEDLIPIVRPHVLQMAKVHDKSGTEKAEHVREAVTQHLAQIGQEVSTQALNQAIEMVVAELRQNDRPINLA